MVYMRYYIIFVGFLTMLNTSKSLGGEIDVLIPQTEGEYIYGQPTSTTLSANCSSGNYFLEPVMTLPAGYEFYGRVDYVPPQNVAGTPIVVGDYPQVFLWGVGYQNNPRTTYWPINPGNGFAGLHWLCGTPAETRPFTATVPNEIKIRGGKNVQAAPESLSVNLYFRGVNGAAVVGLMGRVDYKLISSPSKVSAGKIINKDNLNLGAGEQAKVLWTENLQTASVNVDWQKLDAGNWYSIVDQYGYTINNSRLNAKYDLPLYVKISDKPPIGKNKGSIRFNVSFN